MGETFTSRRPDGRITRIPQMANVPFGLALTAHGKPISIRIENHTRWSDSPMHFRSRQSESQQEAIVFREPKLAQMLPQHRKMLLNPRSVFRLVPQ